MSWFIIALCIRVALVCGWRNRRLAEIHYFNMAQVYVDNLVHIEMGLYATLGSEWLMLIDLRRWTYRSFYPRVLDPNARARALREGELAMMRVPT